MTVIPSVISLSKILAIVFFTLWMITAQAKPSNPSNELPSRLVILQYHHVSDHLAPSTSVSFTDFYQHLQLIEQLQAEVSDITTAVQRIKQQPTGLFYVAISFDDASTSLLDKAIPELLDRQWPFTIFVNTEAVVQQHKNTMSWQQIKQLKDQGAIIANHSHSHSHLIQQSDWQADINKAQQLLKKYIYHNKPVPKLFSYPFGEYDPVIAEYFNRNQWLAVGQHSGAVGVNSDFSGMPRFAISKRFSSLKSLRTKLLTLPFPAKKSLRPSVYQQSINNFTLLFDDTLPSDFQVGRIHCFHSEHGAIHVSANSKVPSLTINNIPPFKYRRGKINCTLPHARFRQNFYWFSKVFINKSCNELSCPNSL